MLASKLAASRLAEPTLQVPEPVPSPIVLQSRWQRLDTVLLCTLCAVLALVAGLRGAVNPFWFDEVSTAYIAKAPTWHDMLLRSRLVDLHPPLEPALVRLCFHLFGPHEFAGHLPSVLGLCVGVGALYVFLRRRLTSAWALLGALLPVCNTDVYRMLAEARPYGILFGATALALASYDTIALNHLSRWARPLLALALAAALGAHLFGVFTATAFLLAEAVRSLRTRRLDLWTWLAVLLPWLSCAFYIPLLRVQAAGHGSPLIYPPAFRSSLRKGLLFFHDTLYLPLAPFIKVAALVLLCVRFFPSTRSLRSFRLTPETATLLLFLLGTSVLETLLLDVRAAGSAFFPRYAIAAVPPACILLTCLLAWRSGQIRWSTNLLLAAVLIGCAVTLADLPGDISAVLHHGLTGAPAGLDQTGGVERICPNLPLAINDPLHFLEFDFHLVPTTEPRMIYASDHAESLRLEHEDATQIVAPMADVFHTPHHVVQGAPFLAAHQDFLLMTRPGHTGWLTDRLAEEHASLKPLGPVHFAGHTSELWLVTQPAAGPFPATATCPAH